MPDPVVSPADTIRQAFDGLRQLGAFDYADAGDVALDALLAVGERDKAEIETLDIALKASVEALHNALAAGERDRWQIARLAEAIQNALYELRGSTFFPPKPGAAIDILAAALAVEEDAQP